MLKTEFNNIEAENDMKIVRQNKRKNLSFVAGSLFLGTLLGTTSWSISNFTRCCSWRFHWS